MSVGIDDEKAREAIKPSPKGCDKASHGIAILDFSDISKTPHKLPCAGARIVQGHTPVFIFKSSNTN